MNLLEESLQTAHLHYLTQFDKQAGIDSQDPQRHIKRLNHTRVMIFFQGVLGKALLSQWLSLPFLDILLVPVTSIDGQALKKLYPHLNAKAQHATVKFEPVNLYELERQLDNRHLCVLATNRPFPALANRLNEAIFRTQTAVIFAQVFGAKFMLGPTVMAGQTACYACYTRQLLANSPHPEADLAMQQHFSSDETTNFMGQHPSINQMATGFIVAEVLRFIMGHHPPQTLSKEITTNLLLETTLHSNLITQVNGCPVCHTYPIPTAITTTPSLADVVTQYNPVVEVNHAKR